MPHSPGHGINEINEVSDTTENTENEEPRAMSGTVTMYSTSWCGYCRRLKGQMEREGIAYVEVNIEQDPASAKFVEEANGGNQTVPTLLISSPSGKSTTLTNPSVAQVKSALSAV